MFRLWTKKERKENEKLLRHQERVVEEIKVLDKMVQLRINELNAVLTRVGMAVEVINSLNHHLAAKEVDDGRVN